MLSCPTGGLAVAFRAANDQVHFAIAHCHMLPCRIRREEERLRKEIEDRELKEAEELLAKTGKGKKLKEGEKLDKNAIMQVRLLVGLYT